MKHFKIERCQSLALVYFVLAFTAGCQIGVRLDSVQYAYQIPVGSTIKLNQVIRIPPEHAGSFIQFGEVYPYAQIDVYKANCRLEVKSIDDNWRDIAPDQFKIVKIQRENELVALEYPQYASAIFVSDGGATAENFVTAFYLRSENQPHVFKLTCQHWDDPATGNDLTIADMQRALGKLISLEINP